MKNPTLHAVLFSSPDTFITATLVCFDASKDQFLIADIEHSIHNFFESFSKCQELRAEVQGDNVDPDYYRWVIYRGADNSTIHTAAKRLAGMVYEAAKLSE